MPKRRTVPAVLLSVHDDRVLTIRRDLKKHGVEFWAPQFLEYLSTGPEARMLFPGYAFARIENQWNAVSATKGVLCVVRFGEEVARVPELVWQELSKLRGPTGYLQFKPRFNRWSRVRMRDSTSGLGGIVQERVSANRVRVLFQILGRKVEMVVADGDLEAAA